MTIIYTSASAYFVVAQYSIQPTHKQNPTCETTHLRHVTPFVKNDILFGPNKNHETSCFLVGVFNPSEKYHIFIYSHIDHLPQIGVNIKNIWNHHLVHPSSASSKWALCPQTSSAPWYSRDISSVVIGWPPPLRSSARFVWQTSWSLVRFCCFHMTGSRMIFFLRFTDKECCMNFLKDKDGKDFSRTSNKITYPNLGCSNKYGCFAPFCGVQNRTAAQWVYPWMIH